MATHQFSSLKDILDEMIQEMRIGSKLNELKVKKIWYEQMQGVIAKNTNKIILRDGILYVAIQSSVVKQELFMAREKICQIINDRMGEKIIKDVIIR